MFIIVLFAFAVSVSVADLPVTPPATPPPPILCGETPARIIQCLGYPKLVKPEVDAYCRRKVHLKSTTQCGYLTCVFNKSGWFDGDKVDRTKLTTFFEQYAKDHPAWAPAVGHVETDCLTSVLPAQGIYLDCPAYDVWRCVASGLIKNATPSQWSTEAECEYPRQFAAACPLCPDECFAPLVPAGSCNACALLPRTP